jgi:RNA polymerase sigma-70 factor, ECF subfamily
MTPKTSRRKSSSRCTARFPLTITTKGAFATWVTTITRNLLVDHFRKGKQQRLTDSLDATSEHEDAVPLSEQIQDQSAPPDAHVRSREVGETVHAALGKLSPSCGKQ